MTKTITGVKIKEGMGNTIKPWCRPGNPGRVLFA